VLIRDALFKFKPRRTITKAEFKESMQNLGFTSLPLDEIYNLFDGARSDKAEIVEILVGLSTAASTWNGSSQIKFCFDLYDKDGSGKVTLKDMSKMFRVIASDVETSVAERFSFFFESWKPTQSVTFNELQEEINKKDGDLKEEMDEKPLGNMELEEREDMDTEDDEYFDPHHSISSKATMGTASLADVTGSVTSAEPSLHSRIRKSNKISEAFTRLFRSSRKKQLQQEGAFEE